MILKGEFMQPTNNIGYLLQHLSTVLARQSDQALQEQLGIGFSQFKILMVLKWNPNVQQRSIANNLGQTEASISRQIKLLHDEGLLTTRINQENRRQHITTPTAKGERLTEKALVVLNSFHNPVFSSISDKQKEQLLAILKTMHETACAGRTNSWHHSPSA
jgi:DNA-binding MarR family transcriptional regulator